MFLFYINDLMVSVASIVRLFADDTILYNCTDKPQTLQRDLSRLEHWEQVWDMEFHPSKCQQITFSRKRLPTQQPLSPQYQDFRGSENQILRSDLDTKISWNAHISSIAAKGNSTLGFVRRNVLTTSEQVKASAYKQLVQTGLVYASAT